jgi:D-arabinan exo alpha-(1,3)/(1,5)-arabinofuranosidase (non-reducing end)
LQKLTRAGFVKSLFGVASAPIFGFSNSPLQETQSKSDPNQGPGSPVGNAPALSRQRSFGTAGKEELLHPGQEHQLFFHKGSGCLTHMWFGGDWQGYESTRIRFYVDGETDPSIDMKLFPGHGIGWGDPAAPWGSQILGKTGHPSGLYNTYRIPFGRSVRITGQLAGAVKTSQPFWWIFRGVENLAPSLSEIQLPEDARLHLYTHENVPLEPLEMFEIGQSRGAGALYQVMLAVRSGSWSFLEAMFRAYIDGATEPLLLSSGTEDYFLGTYYFNRGMYHLPLAGLTHKSKDPKETCSFSAYRIHDKDPVLFQKGLRLLWRNGEAKDGKVYGPAPPLRSQVTSYVWVYEW